MKVRTGYLDDTARMYELRHAPKEPAVGLGEGLGDNECACKSAGGGDGGDPNTVTLHPMMLDAMKSGPSEMQKRVLGAQAGVGDVMEMIRDGVGTQGAPDGLGRQTTTQAQQLAQMISGCAAWQQLTHVVGGLNSIESKGKLQDIGWFNVAWGQIPGALAQAFASQSTSPMSGAPVAVRLMKNQSYMVAFVIDDANALQYVAACALPHAVIVPVRLAGAPDGLGRQTTTTPLSEYQYALELAKSIPAPAGHFWSPVSPVPTGWEGTQWLNPHIIQPNVSLYMIGQGGPQAGWLWVEVHNTVVLFQPKPVTIVGVRGAPDGVGSSIYVGGDLDGMIGGAPDGVGQPRGYTPQQPHGGHWVAVKASPEVLHMLRGQPSTTMQDGASWQQIYWQGHWWGLATPAASHGGAGSSAPPQSFEYVPILGPRAHGQAAFAESAMPAGLGSNDIARKYEQRNAGVGEAVGLGDATANEMFNAAQKSYLVALNQYEGLVDTSGGTPNSKLSLSWQDARPQSVVDQATAYNQQMNQTMSAFVMAVQQALYVTQYIASKNANANSDATGVSNILQNVKSYAQNVASGAKPTPSGSTTPASNWDNCNVQNTGTFTVNTNFKCYPDAGWLEFTYAVQQFAANAITMAQQALALPPLKHVVIVPVVEPCPPGQRRINGRCEKIVGVVAGIPDGLGASADQIAAAIQNAKDAASAAQQAFGAADYTTAIGYCTAATTAAMQAELTLTSQPQLAAIDVDDSQAKALYVPSHSWPAPLADYTAALGYATDAQSKYLQDSALPANNPTPAPNPKPAPQPSPSPSPGPGPTPGPAPAPAAASTSYATPILVGAGLLGAGIIGYAALKRYGNPLKRLSRAHTSRMLKA